MNGRDERNRLGRRWRRGWVRACLLAATIASCAPQVFTASDQAGQVRVGGVPVPGATVIATHGDERLVAFTDAQGMYRLVAMADSVWSIRVEMAGFSPAVREISTPFAGPPLLFDLTLLSVDEITKSLPPAAAAPRSQTAARSTSGTTAAADSRSPAPRAAPSGFRRADVTASPATTPAAASVGTPPDAGATDPGSAADGFLINGSVNNGAASPFAQLRAFGNSRPGQRSLYNGGIGILGGTSAWDARPFSFTSLDAPKPSYADVHFIGTLGGPLRIPGIQNGPTFFLGIQRTADTSASTQSGRMPTALERSGDFSQSRDAAGRPVQPVDPRTGQPFAGSVIPRDRISPQAASLLGYYPQPNITSANGFNYQAPILTDTRQQNVQLRLTQAVNRQNQLFGTFAYQRTSTGTIDLFRFEDATLTSGIDAAANWNHRLSQTLSFRSRYQFTRLTSSTTPYFANRANVSADAGIAGNNQEPVNWGPPSLTFTSGVTSLSDALPAFTRTQTHAAGLEAYWSRGRHNLTFGGDVRRHHIDIRAQQDPRGSFAFTGAATGSDLADFLLGVPSISAIAYGNADKFLRGSSSDAYLSDDWRVSPVFTVNAGVRWEYEAPLDEALGRLVNLSIAPGFTSATPVIDSLLRPDRRLVEPRVGISWRPIPGSSLVVRAGYGIYANTPVYQSIVTQLAQQPPLSTTFSAENSAATPLTLANGFIARPSATLNTFAVDPDFRVGYAHNWQASLQRDLPGSLTTTVTYLGTKGSHLLQELLPNTYAPGAVNPCPGCPSGFVYLASNGSSSRHSGQFQLRRRLRNGLTATVQYTLSKATDNAAAFSGATLAGVSIAQDWLNLDAEKAPSSFDQRHLATAQFEYTTGVGVAGGALLNGWKGALWKNWTFTSQLTAGSGLPLTPIVLVPVRGTAITGAIRADRTGASTDAPDGYYINPGAYAAPAAGRWGNAGRNSITGPRQFLLNAGITRTFPRGNRLNLDWRLDATNVLSRVTYSSVNTIVGSPQFGLPNRANTMRKIQTSVRLRF